MATFGAYTFGDMQSRVVQETGRDDLADNIRAEILDAIGYYRSQEWFNTRATWTQATTASTNLYTLPADAVDLAMLSLVNSGEKYPLEEVPYEQLELMDGQVPGITGLPSYFAYFNLQVRLYPTPDSSGYSLTAPYQAAPSVPVADSDGGTSATPGFFWMNQAEQLVRCRAKAKLYAGVVKQPEFAQIEQQLEKQAYWELTHQNVARLMSGQREACGVI